jgi:hypothetical protein
MDFDNLEKTGTILHTLNEAQRVYHENFNIDQKQTGVAERNNVAPYFKDLPERKAVVTGMSL